MKVRDIMSRCIRSVLPTESLSGVAALMARHDVGAVPVVDAGRVVGIVTDRDLAVRGLAAGLQGGTPVFRIMTAEVTTCEADDEFADVLLTMAREQVRRVPVCTPSGELIGLVSLSDAAQNEEYAGEAAQTLSAISSARSRYCQRISRLDRRTELPAELVGF